MQRLMEDLIDALMVSDLYCLHYIFMLHPFLYPEVLLPNGLIVESAQTFYKVQSHFFWIFAILVLASRFAGFTAVGMVLTFCFLCGLLFSST